MLEAHVPKGGAHRCGVYGQGVPYYEGVDQLSALAGGGQRPDLDHSGITCPPPT